MGKFADFNIKNNTENTNVSQSNSGGFNVQNTQVINNRTINNHYTKQNSNGDGDVGAFMAGAAILTVGIGFVIWSFFTHYQEIYPILKTGALFSPVLSIIGIIALVLREEIETTDVVRFFFIVLAGGSVFLLNEYLNISVPQEIIDLSKQAVSVSGFWNGLNEYGKNLSLSLISSSILIGVSIILIIFAAFRELSYALANKNESGFWFASLKLTNLFRVQALGNGGIITLILAMIFLTLNGYVFHFEWN
ncbi:DUF2157 domain-containing protein [Escherichia coli]|uniref:DUF2157 domain-containing protein n=1 Tax=Escherichia coli TaxID=562 RepID=A0A244B8U8_ECOLX|nr:DUF2157 domain-containing protein [Escherichia coli]EFB2601403.1 DUF2157 domain-containing protein [Escherichia coli]EFH4868886.1 DUF2157 domain-containing protein [Escherichia coli]EFU9146556.1 DUF2157 domain-containing protein [Escherichia coli]EGK2933041.1 DUF2157 domain-containing protein [Escherichia coli]EHA7809336.1 DUF2157 domain-containing protein [Escherichia coli]